MTPEFSILTKKIDNLNLVNFIVRTSGYNKTAENQPTSRPCKSYSLLQEQPTIHIFQIEPRTIHHINNNVSTRPQIQIWNHTIRLPHATMTISRTEVANYLIQ